MKTLKIQKLKSRKRKAVSRRAKLVIVGLTPGKVQHAAIDKAKRPREGAFKGQMRSRMHRWFGTLGINRKLGIVSMDDMYLKPRYSEIVYMTSLLRDPVYNANGSNYSGYNPKPSKHIILNEMGIETVKLIEKSPKRSLIIPLGDIVGEFMKIHFEGKPIENRILYDFPHPSGLNSTGEERFKSLRRRFRRQVKGVWDTP